MPVEDVAGGRKEIADADARGCASPGIAVGQMRASADLERERERVGEMGSARGMCFRPSRLQSLLQSKAGGKKMETVGGRENFGSKVFTAPFPFT
jgi:hypothetical protein